MSAPLPSCDSEQSESRSPQVPETFSKLNTEDVNIGHISNVHKHLHNYLFDLSIKVLISTKESKERFHVIY